MWSLREGKVGEYVSMSGGGERAYPLGRNKVANDGACMITWERAGTRR